LKTEEEVSMEEAASKASYLLESFFDSEDGNDIFLRNINRFSTVFTARKVKLFVDMALRKSDPNCSP
jgi:hypothetical protein